MHKAIIYVRVSTEEQVQGYSLTNQQDKCKAKAKELGAYDVSVFEEAGVSGEVANRPALMDAISTLHKDKSYRYFICTDPDRLSRDLSNLLVFTNQIERNGVQLVFTDFNRDNTAEGQLFYSMRGAIAQFEKEMIKRRTVAGKIKKASEHKWTHWPDIYGYDYDKGVVTVNETEAKYVRLIFQYASEMGVASLCERLELMGISSPRGSKVWSRTTVRRIIENESYYTGKTYIRKYETSGTHLNRYRQEDEKIKRELRDPKDWVVMDIPTIVDAEVWAAANRRRQHARRRSENNIQHNFLLSGLIRCGHCGKTWHGFSTSRNGVRKPYYVCTYKSPGPPKGLGIERCPTHFVPAQKLDERVWGYVRSWLVDINTVREYNQQLAVSHVPDYDAELEALRQRYKQLVHEEDNLIEQLKRETNTRLRQKLGDELSKLAEETDQVERWIKEREAPIREMAVTIDESVVELIQSGLPHPDEMTFEQRFEVIHEILAEIVISQDGHHFDLDLRPRSYRIN